MKALPFACGVGMGFAYGMIACWSPPADILQCLLMGVVLIAGTGALIWGLAWVLALALALTVEALKLKRSLAQLKKKARSP